MADTELLRLMPAVEQGDVAAMQRVAAIVQATYGLYVEERTNMPSDVSAFFTWRTKTATVPPIIDAETFAVRLHEFGHGIAGECPRLEPHRPDPTVRQWHHCIACETAAWRAALDAVPFSLGMFRRLQSALRTYRGMTPASSAALSELDTLVSFEKTYAIPRQERVVAQHQRELVAMWQQELADQPNSLANARARLARVMK